MANQTPVGADQLESLKESNLELQSRADDVRGRKVFDSGNEHIGKVDDLIVDTSERKVRFLRIGQGGFLGIGEKHFLVPVDAITSVSDDGVHLGSQHQQVSGAPDYDPDLALEDRNSYWGGVYSYWGYPPFWSGGYVYPAYPFYGAPARPGEPRDPNGLRD